MSKHAIVFGAGGAVGEATAHALIAAGWRVTASLRTPRAEVEARLAESGATVRRDDLESSDGWKEPASSAQAGVFATHLSLTNATLERMETAPSRIVAFSSNNVAIHPEATPYSALASAERVLRARFPSAAIIRPTMIYGDPRLATLTRLVRMARDWPVLPLPGRGGALIQPVFYEDLGRAAAWLASSDASGVYAIGGPDVVTMRALYRAILRVARSKARIITIPSWLLRLIGPVLAPLTLYSGVQALRADRDRLAAAQTPLPREIAPRVGLNEGLAQLADAVGRRARNR